MPGHSNKLALISSFPRVLSLHTFPLFVPQQNIKKHCTTSKFLLLGAGVKALDLNPSTAKTNQHSASSCGSIHSSLIGPWLQNSKEFVNISHSASIQSPTLQSFCQPTLGTHSIVFIFFYLTKSEVTLSSKMLWDNTGNKSLKGRFYSHPFPELNRRFLHPTWINFRVSHFISWRLSFDICKIEMNFRGFNSKFISRIK